MKVSVCMATYNGERYVREQAQSILNELGQTDELVVVDDGSTDDTVGVLRSMQDERIAITCSAVNAGHVRAFEKALTLASNDLILLADQDDLWLGGRVKLLTQRLFATGKMLAASNFSLMDDSGHHLAGPHQTLRAADSNRNLGNIAGIFLGRRPYFGCAMALRRELLSVVLPIPRFVEAHDLWIAMAANVLRSTIHVEDETLMRRLHGSNVSPRRRRSLKLALKTRLTFASSLFVLWTRVLQGQGGRLIGIRRKPQRPATQRGQAK